MPDISLTRRPKPDAAAQAAQLRDRGCQIQHRCFRAGTYVEYRSARPRALHCPNERRDHVADKDEITGLRSIAEDLDGKTMAQSGGKNRNYPGIRRIRILPRPINIEEAQAYGPNPVHFARHRGMQLAPVLVGAVRRKRLFRS